MGRVLGLDLGERRIGVAISDPLGATAQGLPTLPRRGGAEDYDAVRRLIARYEVERVVLGLPLNMDGSAGPAAQAARRFGDQLAAALQVPVEMWDERLTTVQAERTLVAGGIRRQRRRHTRDRLAAVLILQAWLDARPGAGD